MVRQKSVGVVVKLSADNRDLKRQLSDSGRSFDLFGKKVKIGFNELAIAGTAAFAVLGKQVADFSVASLKQFGSFDDEMRRVWTLLDGFGQGAFESISDQVRNLSKTLGVDAADSARALYDIISKGGFDSVESFEALDRAIKGALISGTTAQEVGAFYIELSKIVGKTQEDIANISAAAVQVGGFTPAEFGANVGQIVPFARAAGVALEEVSAALALITTQGFQVNRARTSLIQLFSQANKAGTELSNHIKRIFGASLAELVADGADFVDVLQEAFTLENLGLGPGDVNKVEGRIAQIIGAVEAAAPASILLAQINTYKDNLKVIQNSAGLFADQTNKFVGGVGQRFRELDAQLNELKLTLGERLAETGVVEAITQAIEDFAESGAFDEFANAIAEVASVLADNIDEFADLAITLTDLSVVLVDASKGIITALGGVGDILGGDLSGAKDIVGGLLGDSFGLGLIGAGVATGNPALAGAGAASLITGINPESVAQGVGEHIKPLTKAITSGLGLGGGGNSQAENYKRERAALPLAERYAQSYSRLSDETFIRAWVGELEAGKLDDDPIRYQSILDEQTRRQAETDKILESILVNEDEDARRQAEFYSELVKQNETLDSIDENTAAALDGDNSVIEAIAYSVRIASANGSNPGFKAELEGTAIP